LGLQYRVVSSVVERLVYTENVGGSKPSPPTRKYFLLIHSQNLDALLHLYPPEQAHGLEDLCKVWA
jgi:hypothetical protein